MKKQQESLAGILKHRGKSFGLTDLVNTSTKLNEIQKLIAKSRTEGLSFCQLEQEDLRVATDKIIIQGTAMYGCVLPLTEGFAECISNEIIAFILDFGYGELTLAEVITALRVNCELGFRSTGTGEYIVPIVFTGNHFNIAFLSKILNRYISFRRSLDRELENIIDGY